MSILNRRIDLSPLRFTVVDEPFRFRHLALQFPQIERSQSIGHFLGPCCAAIDRLSISLNPRTDALVHGLARYGARPTNRRGATVLCGALMLPAPRRSTRPAIQDCQRIAPML